MIDLYAAFGLVEVLIISVLIVNKLNKEVDVTSYVLELSVTFFTLTPLLLYVADAIGLGIAGTSLATLATILLIAQLALLLLTARGTAIVPRIGLSGLRGFICVGLVESILGFAPMAPNFYPTSLGDTAHHYSYVEYMVRYSTLPRSSDFYPLVHHGLYSTTSGLNYPQAMHILMATLARATAAPAIVFLDSTSVIAAVLTSLAVYRIAASYGSYKVASISALTSFIGGSLALSTQTGSLTTLWGILFVSASCLFLALFERNPTPSSLVWLGFSAVGLALYYPLFVPLVLSGIVVVLFQIARRRTAISALFVAFLSTVAGVAVYSIIQIGGQARASEFATVYLQYSLWVLAEIYGTFMGNPGWALAMILVLGVVSVLAWGFFKDRRKSDPALRASTLCFCLFATYPYLGILFHNPPAIDCLSSCLYFYVPGYNFGLSFGLALLLTFSYLALGEGHKSAGILTMVLINFVIIGGYYFVGMMYYESKHMLIASVLAPVFLVPVFKWIRNVPPSLCMPEIKFSFAVSRRTVLGLLLFAVIACSITVQAVVTVGQQMALRPAAYPGEMVAGEWLRANADRIFPCKNYEYFVTMDVLRAEFFEVASEHQFNLNRIPAGWSIPPYPLSYTYAQWLSFAKPGDILVGDESYPNAIPDGLASLPIGVPMAAYYGYIEILYVNHPVIVVQYLGQSLFGVQEHSYACTAGWSTTG